VMGCETALWLAQHGHRVTIVEQRPRLLEGGTATVPTPNRMMLLDLLPFHGVTVMTEHCVVSVQRDGVVTRPVEQSPERGAESAGVGQAEVFVAADIVVLATGYRSDTTLVEALAGIPAELAVVGDAQRPRTVMAAIWDAYEVALGL